MAKSTRSKVKRAYRAKKREGNVYAAVEAARLERLSSKLKAIRDADKEGDVELADADDNSGEEELAATEDASATKGSLNPDSMELDLSSTTPAKPETKEEEEKKKKISTHGMKMSRRAEWRASKGLPPRPKSLGMNRKGGTAAKSRRGRPHRRR